MHYSYKDTYLVHMCVQQMQIILQYSPPNSVEYLSKLTINHKQQAYVAYNDICIHVMSITYVLETIMHTLLHSYTGNGNFSTYHIPGGSQQYVVYGMKFDGANTITGRRGQLYYGHSIFIYITNFGLQTTGGNFKKQF